MNIKIVKDDTLPVLEFSVIQNGVPVDLTGASVKFYMKNNDTGAVKVNGKSCTVIDPATSGVCRYSWEAADTDTAGEYVGEVEVTFATGKIQTGYKLIPIIIREDI